MSLNSCLQLSIPPVFSISFAFATTTARSYSVISYKSNKLSILRAAMLDDVFPCA